MQHRGPMAPESRDTLLAPLVLILIYLAIIVVSSTILWPLLIWVFH